VRADDDVFIKIHKLEVFLRKLNDSKPIILGRPGFGSKEKRGMLNLAKNKNYCMGGPGIIFSQATSVNVDCFSFYTIESIVHCDYLFDASKKP